jgi:hypothetical protein
MFEHAMATHRTALHREIIHVEHNRATRYLSVSTNDAVGWRDQVRILTTRSQRRNEASELAKRSSVQDEINSLASGFSIVLTTLFHGRRAPLIEDRASRVLHFFQQFSRGLAHLRPLLS